MTPCAICGRSTRTPICTSSPARRAGLHPVLAELEELFALAKFVGVSRPGYELNGQHIVAAFDQLPEEALSLVSVPALAISSTDCRLRAAKNRPIWYLVPDGVVQYVSKRGLYRDLGQTRPTVTTIEETRT